MSTAKKVAEPAQSAPVLRKSGSLSLSQRFELGKTAFSLADLDLGPRARSDLEMDKTLDPQEANDKLQTELEGSFFRVFFFFFLSSPPA